MSTKPGQDDISGLVALGEMERQRALSQQPVSADLDLVRAELRSKEARAALKRIEKLLRKAR